ncbi:MAG: tRNA pseudouridine(38-40) synthase TruA [Verrucomicrobia bacterium]|jgi:tRNA pseudouridine38-40 synthase|nr:tRNA pseudouridine(38-40) synthase TruA [Verrucomicrobiota bacterium]
MKSQHSNIAPPHASIPAAKVKMRLTIAYDGTHYSGWQVQKGSTGVQDVVERALAGVIPGHHRLHSSSRTDTGVHALGMVAHVELPKDKLKVPPRKLRLALNAHLPGDIRIVTVSRARPGFHARFDATGKQYRYFVWNHPAMNPLLRTTAWHVPQALDLAAIRAAAAHFVGQHDFRSFAANRGYAFHDTVRTLTRCGVRRSGSLLTFIIEGDGFLYRMCRGMVGTLIQVGRGRFGADAIPEMFRHKDRRIAGMTAPAHGLVLWKVNYGR